MTRSEVWKQVRLQGASHDRNLFLKARRSRIEVEPNRMAGNLNSKMSWGDWSDNVAFTKITTRPGALCKYVLLKFEVPICSKPIKDGFQLLVDS